MSGTSFRGLIPAWAEISFPSPALEGDSYLSGSDDIKVDGLRSDLIKLEGTELRCGKFHSFSEITSALHLEGSGGQNEEEGGFV